PLSPLTQQYNTALREYLPQHGIACIEIPRLEEDGTPISASLVRSLIDEGQTEELRSLLPQTTFDYLQENNLLLPKERMPQ
ncbi:MAG: hypothetical protein IKL84_00245, partial [Clostridia bacterium]|nr:hypothetical protein [Clostridia bacterium]